MNYQSFADAHLAPFAAQDPAPHIVCAICQDGELLGASASASSGFAELSEPTRSRFRIASMTKSFAAAAILKLRDEGKLQLGDSATHYVPELALDHRWRRVTVGQLLSMRSGLPTTDDPWADRKLSKPDAFLCAELLNSAHFSNDADEEYQYSNLGYMLLGRIISNVSQRHALEYVSQALLEPLGMRETSWELPVADGVRGYRRMSSGFKEETFFEPQSDIAVFAGLCSTLRDLATWVHFMTDGFKKQSSLFESVLSASSRREMQRMNAVLHPVNSTDQDNPPIAYGYGLRASYLGNEWFVGHSGGLPGYGSHMSWSTTTGLGAIALGNATYCRAATLCKEILISIQRDARRPVAKLAHGAEIVISRGQALIDAVRGDAPALPAELFSYNFPQDEELDLISERLRKALEPGDGKTLEVKAERGFAGAIYAGDAPLVFFSLAPVEDYLIQKVRFY